MNGNNQRSPETLGDVTIIDDWADCDEHGDDLTARVRASVALIKAYSPAVYARLTRYVSKIEVTPLAAAGYFDPATRSVQVDRNILKKDVPWTTSLVLVHEITHARISAWGIRSATQADRNKEEAICEMRARAFANRLAMHRPEWQELANWRNQQPIRAALSKTKLEELWEQDRVAEFLEMGLSEATANRFIRFTRVLRRKMWRIRGTTKWLDANED